MVDERERPPGLPLDPYYVIPKSDRFGLTTEQIAEALGITTTEVEAIRMHPAAQRWREKLDQGYTPTVEE